MEFDLDIFDAVEFGDLDTLKSYWKDSININFQDSNGMDLLMIACSYGHIEIVKFLIKHKPNFNNKNKLGQTAIDIATLNDHEPIIALIKN